MAKQLDEKVKIEIVNLYLSKKTVSEIKNQLAVGKTTIYRVLKQQGITLDKTRPKCVENTKTKNVPSDIKNKIVEEYKNGEYVYKISEKFGLTKYIVKNILKENNLEIQRFIRKSKFNSQDVNKMYEMYNCGKTLEDIGKNYNVDPTTISLLFKKYNYKIRDYSHSKRKYTLDEHYFDEINTPNKAYYLGLLYADGSNDTKHHSVTISLQERDKHILESFRTELKTDAPLEFLELSKKKETFSNQYRLTICNKHMSESLERLGMVANKSLILEFPDFLRVDLISHFIRGYFDGDGHVSNKVYCTNIVSTHSFCLCVQNILSSMNIKSKICNTWNPETSTRTLRMTNKKSCTEFLDYIYQDATLYLIRKHDIYLQRYKNILNNSAPRAAVGD